MSVTDALDAMRSELAGCTLVAFTDLSSGLVLRSSSSAKPPQEELDALSRAAQLLLDGAIAEGARGVWEADTSGEEAEVAMLLSGEEAKVFLRSPGEAAEALVCICSPESNLDAVVDCGRTALSRILSETDRGMI